MSELEKNFQPGDLVRGHFGNKVGQWTREGLFIGTRNSNGYIYAEVLWFYENTIGSCQLDLLEVL
tara:strand:+ start:173 stop:367 length:195 start_codon:yes stop_codon:yes gene_type:complete